MDNLIGWSYLTVPDQCDQISGGSEAAMTNRALLNHRFPKMEKTDLWSRRKVSASSTPPLLFKYLS